MMLKFNTRIIRAAILFAVFISGCALNVQEFTKDELKWFKPYIQKDSVIFISERNETDTIIFFGKEETTDTTRNLIELGYYTTKYLSVPYAFTSGSYHQSALMGDGNKRYDMNLFNLSKKSNNQVEFEIDFIGTIFNGKDLNHIVKRAENVYFFDSSKATYTGMNVEKAISNFTFDTNVGIINYTDERNVHWKRPSDGVTSFPNYKKLDY